MGSRLFSVYSLCLLNLASYECITYSLNKFEYKNTYGCQGLAPAVLNQNLYGSGEGGIYKSLFESFLGDFDA